MKRERHWSATHSASKTLLYQVWCGMKQRCYYRRHKNFHLYGGRGISVCPEWKEDFITFKAWAESSGYSKGLLLDRRDGNKNYCPDNCHWVNYFHSNANRRTNRLQVEDAAVIKSLALMGVKPILIGALYGIGTAYVSSIKNGHAWPLIDLEGLFI